MEQKIALGIKWKLLSEVRKYMEDKAPPSKQRKRLLKPRSQKYYSRKAKIEQALLSLEAEKLEQNSFPDIPSSAILYPSYSYQVHH